MKFIKSKIGTFNKELSDFDYPVKVRLENIRKQVDNVKKEIRLFKISKLIIHTAFGLIGMVIVYLILW